MAVHLGAVLVVVAPWFDTPHGYTLSPQAVARSVRDRVAFACAYGRLTPKAIASRAEKTLRERFVSSGAFLSPFGNWISG